MRCQIKIKLGQDFIEDFGDHLVVGLKALPEKGKANQELIKKLARYFKVDVASVKIVSGLSSKNKIVKIKFHT